MDNFYELERQLAVAIEDKQKAELVATQATSELGRCFIKYQQTCAAFNDMVVAKRKLEVDLAAIKARRRLLHNERDRRMSDDKIRELAYLKWEAAGYPQSDGVQYWLQAEEELTGSPPRTCEKQQPRKVAAKATAAKRK